MKSFLILISTLFLSFNAWAGTQQEIEFKQIAESFDQLNLEVLPIKDRGRLKPLDTFARENNLFLTGKTSLFGLTPVSFFLTLTVFKDAENLKLINIRSPDLRTLLGLDKNERLFSLSEVEKTQLSALVQSAFEIEKKNKNLLSPIQNAEIELTNQTWLIKSILNGDLIFEGVKYRADEKESRMQPPLQNLLVSVSSGQSKEITGKWAAELLSESGKAQVEDQFQAQRERMSLEVLYNKWKLFFWAGLLYFIIAFISFLPYLEKTFSDQVLSVGILVPLFMLAAGFAIRVTITEFPPVTNMYGTMIWVSFGISLFSYILFLLYKDRHILGIMSLGSALLLILTENIPLIISPNMDPIVAVLRSSYWLTIHVLTVTISYAAFSMAMILGNIYLIRSLFGMMDKDWIKRFSHYAYRSIQLGVFLLTAGIILGGVWADYSWGRFWGWDPKETWALIADLGFLVLLHGRFAGWISNKKLLLLAPLSYLLVIMAWFGVNFILASGLHSYGFSSGGTFMVVAFFVAQIVTYVFYYSRLVLHSKK